MKYTNIPYVGLPVSRMVLGTSGELFRSGGDVGQMIETALEQGINCLDTARAYGKSEQAIGNWLKHSGRRNEIVLVSKCCHPVLAFVPRVGERAAESDLERSLEALGTDRIDVYMLHRDNPSVPVGKILEFLNRFHEEGKIGAFGGSNWTAKRIAEANDYAKAHDLIGFTVSSPHYSLGWQKRDPWGNGCQTVTGDKNAPQRRYYAETYMPLFCWSSLCSGVFSGKLKWEEWGRLPKYFGINAALAYSCEENRQRLKRCEELAADKGVGVAHIALAWLLTDRLNTLPIIGAGSPKRVIETARAAELELSTAERKYLNLESDSPVD